MDKIIEQLPAIISAAAQSHLGMLALLSASLAVLAYFFFAKASEKVRVGIFVLLFLGVLGFGVAMFRVSADASISPPPAADASVTLSKEATSILKESALDPGGLVLFEYYGASVDLHTNGVSFFTDKGDHRTLVIWESALQELVKADLLVARGDRGDVFEITKKGYDMAERLD